MNETPTPETSQKRDYSNLMWIAVAIAAIVLAFRYPSSAYTVVIFAITLGVLVFVHEWGHFQFARWAGMKVNRFGIGFPPWIYTRHYKGIDYSIGALPIGGMVDIAGLGSEEDMVAGAKGDGEALNVRASRPEMPRGAREFQDASLGWRFWTLFAGPLMNFIFAIVVFIGVFMALGLPDAANSKVSTVVQSVQNNSPAAKAGIQHGDKILGVNGTKTMGVWQISEMINDSAEKFSRARVKFSNAGVTARADYGKSAVRPLTISIERNGKTIQKSITPIYQERSTAGGTGDEQALIVGVEFTQNMAFKKVGMTTAVSAGFVMAMGISTQIIEMLKRAVTFNLSPEEKRGVGGPVKIAQAAGQNARQGFGQLLLFAGLLSVNLGLLNLLPIPALDGGRILFVIYEKIMRRPVDPKKENLMHLAGMGLLLAFMVFITLRDVIH
jgi:regulator of sigma E protease